MESQMTGHSNYALEKLSLAVHYLTVDPGDVRQRLNKAYMEFHPVSENDFHPHLRDDWKWIYTQLTRYGPLCHSDGTVWIGAVDNTLSRIKNSTGVKIAQRIVALRDDLERYLHEKS